MRGWASGPRPQGHPSIPHCRGVEVGTLGHRGDPATPVPGVGRRSGSVVRVLSIRRRTYSNQCFGLASGDKPPGPVA